MSLSTHERERTSSEQSTLHGGSNNGTNSRRRHPVVTQPAWARSQPPDDDLHDAEGTLPRERTLNGRSSLPVPFLRAVDTIPSHNNSTDLEANTRQPDRPQEAHTHGGPSDARWWTFTLPQKYIDRVAEYMSSSGNESSDSQQQQQQQRDKTRDSMDEKERLRKGERDFDRAMNEEKDREQHRHARRSRSFSQMRAQLHVHDFSVHQAQTPGWESPWRPFERTDSYSLGDPFSNDQNEKKPKGRTGQFQAFLLKSAFAPLAMRSLNLAFQIVTLGVACHMHIQMINAGVAGIVGSSPLFCVVISPLAIIHIFTNLYIEYFGSPIGIWHVRTKMSHTLLEVLFIILFSANMSLALDDLITSSLECTPWKPYARFNEPLDVVGTGAIEGSLADSLCGQQIALVATITISVFLYVAVLVVSLFRIFYKVEARR